VVVSLVLAIATALAWAFVADHDMPRSPGRRIAGAATAGGSCLPAQKVPLFAPAQEDRAHGEAPLSRYPSIPPASGPHASIPLPAGSYRIPPQVGRVLHSMEHGAVVIWFDPSVASSKVLQEIVAYLGPSGPGRGLHVIIAPFDYPAEGDSGILPSGIVMAMVAWHRLQSCTRLGPDAIDGVIDFVRNYRCPPECDTSGYRGEAPEAGAPI
jgi:uncharacterized protein DUF3105